MAATDGAALEGTFVLKEDLDLGADETGKPIKWEAGTTIEYSVPDQRFSVIGTESGPTSAPGPGEYFETRSPAVRGLYARISTGRDAGESTFGFARFRNEFNKLNGEVTELDFGYLWMAFLNSQKPLLSREEFSQLYSSIRQSIDRYDATWEVDFRSSAEHLARGSDTYRRRRLAFSDGRLLAEFSAGKSREDIEKKRVETYDGDVRRQLLFHEGKMRGDVMPFNGNERFLAIGGPLQQSMLLDTVLDLDGESRGRDLASMGLYPLEEMVDFEGEQCIQLMREPRLQFYVSPAKNFALVGLSQDRYGFSEDLGTIVENVDYSSRVLTDHKDLGNGLFLPHKSTITWYESGSVVAQEEMRLVSVNLDPQLDSSDFGDIFGDGLFVHDAIRGISYLHGYDPAVGNTLDSLIAPRLSPMRWVLLIVNGLIVVAFLVWRLRSWGTSS
ncbi:MAG: hypothetical protein AAGD07_13425 [Planctomycetota bacterium]